MKTGIIGGNIVLENRVVENGSIVLCDGRIEYAGEKWIECHFLIRIAYSKTFLI